MSTRQVIAITGGIGSGKSVVCRVVSAMGYPVYDCDSRAKQLMDNSPEIKAEIASAISPDAITPEGEIDRQALSHIVFSDPDKLKTLNGITHRHILADITRWCDRQTSDKVFIETAILYQSGLDRMVDSVWEVTAPTDTRVERVARRNGLTHDHIRSRIEAQNFEPEAVHPRVTTITNDDIIPLLPQIERNLAGC